MRAWCKREPERATSRIIRSEPSCYDLAERSGVSRSVLTRFVKGERGLTTDTIDRPVFVLSLPVADGKTFSTVLADRCPS